MADHQKIGVVGAGTMGGGMARNLIQAGYDVTICDIDREKVEALVDLGATTALSPAATVEKCDITLTSLPTSGTFIQVAESEDGLITATTDGKIIIDAGTTSAPETRRLAEAFREKGADLIDAPVSGGGRGADAGTLAVMVGGRDEAVERCWPVFEVIGGNIVHFGASGTGQLGKAVNQIAMGVAEAAFLEAMFIGVKGGLDPGKLWACLSTAGAAHTRFESAAKAVIEDTAAARDCKLRELPYFIEEAIAGNYRLPLTEAFHTFCEHSENLTTDPLGIPTPSFWYELTHRAR